MADTKEKILHESLKLFAVNGYEAVSVSQIAGELGMTKGALYKHYKNKRDIFDSIVARMIENDAKNAESFSMPIDVLSGEFNNVDEYEKVSYSSVKEFTRAQFKYWTEDEFAADFRRLLTLEQYRNSEMTDMYNQYLASGPLDYLTDIFKSRDLAFQFYSPVFMLYSLYDSADDKNMIIKMLDDHLNTFEKRF